MEQQKIAKIAKKICCKDCGGFCTKKYGKYCQHYKDSVATANEVLKSQWVSVKDRLPETIERYSKYVLTTFANGGYVIACYCKETDEWLDGLSLYRIQRKVTHWMPIPENQDNESDGNEMGYKMKFKEGDTVVSSRNPHLTYKVLKAGIPNEIGTLDYRVEIFKDGKAGIKVGNTFNEHNIHCIECDKMDEWGVLEEEWMKLDKNKTLLGNGEGLEVRSFVSDLPEGCLKPESVSECSGGLIEKAIGWFNDIADMCKRLTTGNVSHLGATIRGKAIRSAEFLEKHKEEVVRDGIKEEFDRFLDDVEGTPRMWHPEE